MPDIAVPGPFPMQALDYIRDALLALESLKPIKLFIRGSWVDGNIPQNMNPYCEYYIADNPYNVGDAATKRDGFFYDGTIRFIYNKTKNTGKLNWINIGVSRRYELPTYSLMSQWIIAARNELLRCEHNDLGELTVDTEYACEFSIVRCILGLGLRRGERKNTWYDVGEIYFRIRAQRERAA